MSKTNTQLTWTAGWTAEGTTAAVGCKGHAYTITRTPGGRYRLTVDGVRLGKDVGKAEVFGRAAEIEAVIVTGLAEEQAAEAAKAKAEAELLAKVEKATAEALAAKAKAKPVVAAEAEGAEQFALEPIDPVNLRLVRAAAGKPKVAPPAITWQGGGKPAPAGPLVEWANCEREVRAAQGDLLTAGGCVALLRGVSPVAADLLAKALSNQLAAERKGFVAGPKLAPAPEAPPAAAQGTTHAKPAPAEPVVRNKIVTVTEGRSGGKQYKVCDHPVTAVLRWMGSKGWTVAECKSGLDQLGLTDVSINTVKAQQADGKSGRGRHGTVPALDKGCVATLTALRGK